MGLSGELWEFIGLSIGISVASCSFGGTFQETIFFMEGYLIFVINFFGSFLVDCCMVHCPSFASFA
jgi:hypothetical protein